MCTRLQQAAARAILHPMENYRPLCGFVVLVVKDDADTRESLTALIREGLGAATCLARHAEASPPDSDRPGHRHDDGIG